jgi:HSP20 family protein
VLNDGADINKGNKNMSTLTKYNKSEFLTPFDRIFDDFFGSYWPTADFGGTSLYSKSSYPKVDVLEYDDKYVLEADLGGLSKEDVSVELEGNLLVIRGGKRSKNVADEKARYVHREIKRSSFVRTFSIGRDVDRESVKADFVDGLLTVTMKRVKLEEKKPERIKLL